MTNFENCDIICKKKRGRPCAIDRYKTDLIQQKFTNILNNKTTLLASDEFTQQSIMPFIVKRQRRQRANNRERSRMQTLNGAISVLRQHLPVDLYLQSKTNAESLTELTPIDVSKSNKRNLSSVKMTKIDTLRFAAEYIKLLTSVLNESSTDFSAHNRNNFNSSFKNETSFSSDSSSNISTNGTYLNQLEHREQLMTCQYYPRDANNNWNWNYTKTNQYNFMNSFNYCNNPQLF